MLIDDFSNTSLISKLDTQWRGVSDQVMGGVSKAIIAHGVDEKRFFMHVSGDVQLENNGGFIQASLDLALNGGCIDGSGFEGVHLVVKGNGEQYSVHLRTPDNVRSWQSYRAHFTANPILQSVFIPFSEFTPYRIDTPLDIKRLKRIGLVAIGRAFHADFSVFEIGFY